MEDGLTKGTQQHASVWVGHLSVSGSGRGPVSEQFVSSVVPWLVSLPQIDGLFVV